MTQNQETVWVESLGIGGRDIPLVSPIQQRDYQSRVIEKAAKFYSEGLNSVMVESPTGSGKTVMALALLKYLQVEYGWSFGWMTMRRTNLSQARRMNEELFGVEGMKYISMFDRRPPKVDFLVSDEAQHDAASSSATIHSQSGAGKVLGLTATPFRTDKLKLAFQKTIKDAGIHRLIEDGWLARFWHYTIEEYTVPSVADHYLRDRHRWGKTAVYWYRIDDCHRFSRILARRGVEAVVVDGSTKGVDDILTAFGQGEFPVLTSVAKLTEGFDCPTLQTVFIRDASKLPTIQMCGRVLRPCPGKVHANIIQSQNSRWQFPRTAKPEKAFVYRGGRWLALGCSKILNRIAISNSRRLAKAPPVDIPDYFKKQMGFDNRKGFGFEFEDDERVFRPRRFGFDPPDWRNF